MTTLEIGDSLWIPMNSGSGMYVAEAEMAAICECIVILKINGGLFGFMTELFGKIGESIFLTKEEAEEYIKMKERTGG